MIPDPKEIWGALKSATRDLVKACGGQEACTRVQNIGIKRHQSFSEWGDIRHGELLRLDRIALLEADCKDPVVTRELARLSGHVLIKLPAVVHSGSALGRVTGAALKETSDVFAGLGVAMDDDHMAKSEAGQIERDIDDAIEKLLILKLQVRQEAERQS